MEDPVTLPSSRERSVASATLHQLLLGHVYHEMDSIS